MSRDKNGIVCVNFYIQYEASGGGLPRKAEFLLAASQVEVSCVSLRQLPTSTAPRLQIIIIANSVFFICRIAAGDYLPPNCLTHCARDFAK